MNSKKLLAGIVVILLVLIGIIIWQNKGPADVRDSEQSQENVNEQQSVNTNTPATNDSPAQTLDVQFGNPKKSAHYETNTPAHGSILAAPPVNIVIDFNFDLAAPSSISIKKDNQEYGQGDTVIDSNKLSMRRAFAPDAPDGKYTVSYIACWPDKSCHDGNFEFAIDRSLASGYENLQNKSEVTIRLSEIMFAPKNIVISKGTKVTWINDEDVEHYVNTDSHPAHTYYPAQNSRSLAKNATYSVTFDKLGAYPYHCSAHASTMIGNIVVV